MIETREAAGLIGRSERRVRQLLESGHLSGRKIGNKVWLVDSASLERYVRRQKQAPEVEQ